MDASKIVFEFKNRPPYKSKSSQRVAVTVTHHSESYKHGVVNFWIGHDVLQLLGWQRGHDRVQFAEHGRWTALGRDNGQFKISNRGSGWQGTISASFKYFGDAQPGRVGITEIGWKIIERDDGERILMVDSIPKFLREAG
jgi:hypothetical protein